MCCIHYIFPYQLTSDFAFPYDFVYAMQRHLIDYERIVGFYDQECLMIVHFNLNFLRSTL